MGPGTNCLLMLTPARAGLAYLGPAKPQNWMLPLFSEIKCGLLGSQITGLPLMLRGTEPETGRTKRESWRGRDGGGKRDKE